MTVPAVDTAIILAGGLGTRLRSVVPDLPKPLAPVAGRPFLCHLMDYWLAQGIRRFVLSVGYRAEMIRSALGDSYRGAPIAYAEETTPLGTGGGLLQALRQVASPGPVLLLNGDTFFAVDLAELAAFHQAQAADWTMCTFRTAVSGRYLGMHINSERTVTRFDSGASEGWREANGGVYLISPARLPCPDAPETTVRSLENDLFPAWLAAGVRFAACPVPGAFIDIGVPEDYFRAASVIAADAAGHPAQS